MNYLHALRRVSMLLLLVFVSMAGKAIPARPLPISVKQPDGTILTLYVRGDEMSHWLQTADDVLLVQGEDGAYYYAVADADGLLVCSSMLAHNSDERTEAEKALIRENKEKVQLGVEKTIEQSMPMRQQFRQVARSVRSSRSASVDNSRNGGGIEKMRGLIILVEFSDTWITVPDPQNAFYKQFNQKGYSENGHIGSVHDYFYDQSYGQFDLSLDVVGPVRLPNPLAYYGQNNAYGADAHAARMVSEACKLVNPDVDFSQYDNDGDGYVDMVYIIYAGYSEASTGVSTHIWPHKHSLYGRKYYYNDGDGFLRLDGVFVNEYACSNELGGSEGHDMTTIGSFCHEFSHCLGLPDFYDVSYKGGFGMEGFDLMASGNYNGPDVNGSVPCGYTAYERWQLGWLHLEELAEPSSVKNMPSLNDAPVAYIVRNDGTSDEFFVLENRQNSGWFSYVSQVPDCHGMLITHVDFDYDAWDNNEVNTLKTHQRMSYVPADNDYGNIVVQAGKYFYQTTVNGMRGDLFPGLYGVTAFTDDTHPNCGGKLFNLNADGTRKLGKPITNITEANGLISFDFMGGSSRVIYDAIDDVSAIASAPAVAYDLSGKAVENMSAPGVYVVKENGTTRKVVVR